MDRSSKQPPAQSPKLSWALTQTHGCARNLICIKRWALKKQPGGASEDFTPWGGHGAAFSGSTAPHIVVTVHENIHGNITSTRSAYSLLVLKHQSSCHCFLLTHSSSWSQLNWAILVFILAPRVHVVFIHLFISSAAGASGLHAQWHGRDEWLPGAGTACWWMGGGGSMLMAYCFKAFARCNL